MDLSIYKAKPDKTIREHTDELLQNLEILKDLNYIKNEKIYKLTKIACEYHDYGKVNNEFQKRIYTKAKFNENTEMAHNVLSLYFIDKNKFESMEEYIKVGFAVLNHHNYCNNLRMIEDESYKELIQSLLKGFEVNRIGRNISSKIAKMSELENDDAILIKGFLHKCDYSASGGIPIEYKNDFLNCGLRGLLGKWRSKDCNSNWNELQQFCIENKNKNIVVVAQTGMGKTEAGLHWIGDNKGFFILPLKTAINAIYDRIKKDILNENHFENKLALLHSDALSYYNNDNKNEMDIMDYYKQSKQLSIPLSISTLDQLFDFVMKYQGYELKLATLSYSKIVIDEIQMYGPDLLAYLIYGIKRVNKLGGKIAILTATLAPFIKDLLKDGDNPIGFEEKTFINDLKRHNLKVYDSEIDTNTIFDKFTENKQKGFSNKILVVCNTVKKAQHIYYELEKRLPNIDINLLHSKFIKHERATKEKEIFEFGKTDNIDKGIWVTTQIVEASLDIDFDYLFTELSDISGLFQRMGRCNRKGVKPTKEPNCFVFLKIDKNLLINGNKGFIDSKIYALSKEAMKNVNGLLTEQNKLDIINEYLTSEELNGSDYLFNYRKFAQWIERLDPYDIDKKDVKFRNIIAYDVIPIKVYQVHQKEIDENLRLLLEPKADKLRKLLSEQSDIDKGESKLKEILLKEITLKEIMLKEEIKKYTVPVGIYDIYFKRGNAISNTIKLSKNEFIYVVNCQYNELGFKRLTSEEIKGIVIEDTFDNFS